MWKDSYFTHTPKDYNPKRRTYRNFFLAFVEDEARYAVAFVKNIENLIHGLGKKLKDGGLVHEKTTKRLGLKKIDA